ncbi:DedA family protein [Sporomusa acidovorans]|uniref:VTT domain-containing protein n=1 Tax=Sporomusa acidovorans (strain ATCC 49682 / DSM 3132 / Mol) TaxID=1123286 RepID=A0ABZ3IZM4_SPOA4|nr:DedA family protein [Sporomusa acidovorans]OZC14167.1 inner membrane protein YabI [Sporomusa acidovorans DSM 3132]SDE70231.1 membrane protein DedA, SNARE-associated domain [Sporomusa acidovorans]
MEQAIQEIVSDIGSYGYFTIFTAMLLTGIGLPLPGEITLAFTGYLVYSGQFEMIPAIAAAASGDLLGAVIGYGMGFFGRTKVIRQHFSFLMPADSKLVNVEKWLNKYGVFAVFFGRILPVIRGAIPIPAGFVQMNGRAYVSGLFISSLIWCGALIVLGLGLGYNWQKLAGFSHSVGLSAMAVLAVALLTWYFSFLRKKLK